MSRIHLAVLLAVFLTGNAVHAQSVIISRPPISEFSPELGTLTGETDRFGDFVSLNAADYFVLEEETTITSIKVYGTDNPGTGFNGNSDGFSIHILEDNGGQPDGLPFDPAGEFGSDGVVYFFYLQDDENVGFDYIFDGDFEDRVQFTIDFTVANGGEPVTLPAGAYWLSVANNVCCDSLGSPVNQWFWQRSVVSSGVASQMCEWDFSNSVPDSTWLPINDFINQVPSIGSAAGGSFAWEMEGEEATQVILGDVNMDGVVDLLDVAPFVQLIGSGQFQTEADINQDGAVDLLDVSPFVDLLAG